MLCGPSRARHLPHPQKFVQLLLSHLWIIPKTESKVDWRLDRMILVWQYGIERRITTLSYQSVLQTSVRFEVNRLLGNCLVKVTDWSGKSASQGNRFLRQWQTSEILVVRLTPLFCGGKAGRPSCFAVPAIGNPREWMKRWYLSPDGQIRMTIPNYVIPKSFTEILH